MKREHSYITAMMILCCLLLWSLFSGYEIKKKEPLKEVVIEVKHDTVIDTKKVVVLEKKVKQLKRKLKKVTWVQDSLKAEEIRKDGIISYFPKQEFDGQTYIEVKPNEYIKIK